MKKIQSKSYFNLAKTSQWTEMFYSKENPAGQTPPKAPSNEFNENFGDDSFEGDTPMARKDKEYFASIGVRIRVPTSNPQQEQQLARQAFEAVRDQIQMAVNEDEYEAWLSGRDEEPKTMNGMMDSI